MTTEPLRYGHAKLSTVLADFDSLRAAIKLHDSFAAETAWNRCERWLDVIQTATPPPHTDTERRPLAVEEAVRLMVRAVRASLPVLPAHLERETLRAIIAVRPR